MSIARTTLKKDRTKRRTGGGIVLDVRKHVSCERQEFVALEWPIPPNRWTHADVLDVASRVAVLIKTPGPFRIGALSWYEGEGFEFSVSDPKHKGSYPWVTVRVPGMLMAIALTLADFTMMQAPGHRALVEGVRGAPIRPRVIGPQKSNVFLSLIHGKVPLDSTAAIRAAGEAEEALVRKARGRSVR